MIESDDNFSVDENATINNSQNSFCEDLVIQDFFLSDDEETKSASSVVITKPSAQDVVVGSKKQNEPEKVNEIPSNKSKEVASIAEKSLKGISLK